MTEQEVFGQEAPIPEEKAELPQKVLIGADQTDWQERIRQMGIDPAKGELALESDGCWYWKLKPSEIEDPEERKRAQEEEEAWEG